MTRILLLGGTTEASRLARALCNAGLEAVFSYAGRTDAPVAQPLPVRVGGFGGAEGLAAYLRGEGISHVVDATHPFAAQMSRNAIAACKETGIPLIALERPAWTPGPGDDWQAVADTPSAVAALPQAPARVFLAIGKQTLAPFAAKPQHHYLLRLVDPPEMPLPLPQTSVVIARGPFDAAGDTALMRAHGITHIVAKNAGGAGAEAKLTAARALRLPVILIDRPALPPRNRAATVEEVMRWLSHAGTERGV
ncbi:cobalt-precorrin-6A reductase [Tabrizicola fusiformis]|uniref:cobalt-precorrin-6A reductase n=1 Tax=Tabrizicola sp. SY72 TaxID=2741673 RepID=UPI0015737C65|nr:cobalt-precorrin-6A reductase [Tabrizicola sp. SY72]NTT87669.1 cobalt-precorrin-6A reductase [Tabrizicola sp. SY72]